MIEIGEARKKGGPLVVYRIPAELIIILVKKYLRTSVDDDVGIKGLFIPSGKFGGNLGVT